jgi:cytochrome c oxidase subunit II
VSDLVSTPSPDPAEHAERIEHRWAAIMVALMVLLVAIATFEALYHAAVPQARVETVDPARSISAASLSKAISAARLNPTVR